METTIRIHTDALTPQMVEGIQTMFPAQVVDIVVRAVSGPIAETGEADAGFQPSLPPQAGNILADVYSLPPGGYSLPLPVYSPSQEVYSLPLVSRNKPEAAGNKSEAAGNEQGVAGNEQTATADKEAPAGNILPPREGGAGAPTEEALLAILHRALPGVVHPTSLRGSTRLLLHLAGQATGNSGKLLAERSGFSYSGAVKHMMLLRRRGLVVRRGWQHYVLTDKALEYLSAAAEAAK